MTQAVHQSHRVIVAVSWSWLLPLASHGSADVHSLVVPVAAAGDAGERVPGRRPVGVAAVREEVGSSSAERHLLGWTEPFAPLFTRDLKSPYLEI